MQNDKSSNSKIDMLHGGLIKPILLCAIPLAASSILQQLFNSADVAIVGNFVSDPSRAQAAVGCNASVINLIINLFVGISVGANVIISNYIGKKEEEKANRAVHTAMVTALLSGIILLGIGMVIARPLLSLMNTPADVLPYAVKYLRIYSLGMPFIMVYNFSSAVLRCVGDTKRPLCCLTLSGIINVVLNICFVVLFKMDVDGVAIATVISNIFSAGMVWRILCKETGALRLEYRKLRIQKEDFIQIMKIGMPAGLQGVVFSLSNVCIQAMLNQYGKDAVAGSAVSNNFESIAYFVIMAFSQTAVTFTSQNYGAGQYERCKKVFKDCLFAGIVLSGGLSLIFFLGKSFFVGLFTNEVSVAQYAVLRMQYILLFNFIANTYEAAGAAMRGMGYSMTPAVITVVGTCAFRLVWAYTIGRIYHSFRLLIAVYPLSWVLTGIMMLIAYYLIRKKLLSSTESKA